MVGCRLFGLKIIPDDPGRSAQDRRKVSRGFSARKSRCSPSWGSRTPGPSRNFCNLVACGPIQTAGPLIAQVVLWTLVLAVMNGTPMGRPWAAHGPPMGHPWAAHRPPMGRPGAAHGTPMGRPWATHGPPIGRPWAAHGPPMGRPWAAHGPPMDRPWAAHGPPLGRPKAAHEVTTQDNETIFSV